MREIGEVILQTKTITSLNLFGKYFVSVQEFTSFELGIEVSLNVSNYLKDVIKSQSQIKEIDWKGKII